MEEHEFVPGWIELYESCVQHGWNPRTTMSKLETSILSMYGVEYLKTWKLKMEMYLRHREKK
jgi:hypothetical protein